MYRSLVLVRAILAAAVTAMSSAYANAQQFLAVFSGYNVVPPVFSTGQAKLTLSLNQQQQSLTYTLTYSSLSAPITSSLMHFGRAREDGGVIAFLCGTPTNPGPSGTPTCPSPSGSVSGMITPASVIGPVAQGIAAGTFNGLVGALTSASTYASIHNTNFPAGEIRGEIIQCPPSGC
jgi:hypothetical protein